MKPVRYVLKTGDTLWSVAGAHYGDPVRWPDLYAFNNRPDIIALTERPLVNPDRLVPGQAIFLPSGHDRSIQRRAPAGQATNPLRGGRSASRTPGDTEAGARGGSFLIADSLVRNTAAETLVNDFAHSFRLDNQGITVQGEAFGATLQVSGAIALQRCGLVPLVSYSSRSAETQARTQSAMLLGRLLASREMRLGWDARAGRVRYRAALTDLSGIDPPDTRLRPGATARGEPVLTAEIVVPDFFGRIANHAYLGQGVTIAVALRTTASASSVDQRSADPLPWVWASAEATPDAMILGAILSEVSVTPGNGLADLATILGAPAAGRSMSASQVAVSLSWTPVQIGS